MRRTLGYVPLFLMVVFIIMAAFRLPTGQSTVAPRPPRTHTQIDGPQADGHRIATVT